MLSIIEANFASPGSGGLLPPTRVETRGHTEPAEFPRLANARPQVTAGTVLVVDDDATNRDVLSRRLKRQGHHVRMASNGPDALRMMRESPFDIVLLDVMMPDMDG